MGKKDSIGNIEVLSIIAIGAGIAIVVGKAVLNGVPDSLLEAMAQAIKNFEGWSEGSVSWRNNNPGNLKFANQPGAIGFDPQGHATFDSYESGWKALKHQLEISFLGKSANFFPSMTLYQFFDKYAEANSEPYARSVASALGVAPTDTLADVLHDWKEA